MLIGALSLAGCRPAFVPEDVNVILISIDTLRADYLNVLGYNQHRLSPNIDALANDGILHAAHISASPWTIPSHMSLLTSLHPSTHGLLQSFGQAMTRRRKGAGFNRLAEERLTLAEVLHANGFTTAAFTGGITVDAAFGFGQGFSAYTPNMYKLTESRVAAMLDWIGEHAQRPFFLFWHTFEVHAPYLNGEFLGDEHAQLRAAHARLSSTMGASEASLGRHGSLVQRQHRLLREHGAFNPKVCSALYAGGVRSVDRWIGRLMRFLRDRGLYDRTLIVLTSDHGEEFAEHNHSRFCNAHGHSAYEEMVRVPLIVKLPRQRRAGLRVEEVTRHVDVMPTILDILGLVPAESEMQGESLVPLWSGAQHSKRLAFTEAAAKGFEVKSVRSDRYKYIVQIPQHAVSQRGRRYVPDAPRLHWLFDLQDDPLERNNLLSSPQRAKTRRTQAVLAARLRSFVVTEAGPVNEVALDEAALQRLRALGYVR